MTNLTRRTFGKGAIGLSAAAFAGFGPAQAQALKSFTVTEPVHSIDSLPFYAAIKNGYFKEAGLDLTLITTEGGGKHIAAVLAGDAQAYIGGPEHIAFVLAKGGEQLKAVVALSNRANAFLVARTGVEVPEGVPFLEQIRGKKIGVGTRGGTGYSIMLYLLENAGMDPRSDVTLVEIANEAGQLAAMQAGAVDMAMVTEPMITKGVQEGIWLPPFASMPKELGLFAWTTLNVPQTLIGSDPALVQAMVNATLKGLAYVTSDPEGARTIAREEFPTLPPADLEAMLVNTMENDMWQSDGAIPPEAWDKTKSIVTIAGLLKEDVPYENVFDPQFMSAAG
jgi:NitT/TauT family transport system substrate-binding protein